MKYQIKIPRPCNERWDKMSPTDKGAFCSNCKKEVLDFTNMPNYQLAKLLDENQSMCGKFKPEQLNFDIRSLKQNRQWNIRFFLGFSTILSLSIPTYSQNKTVNEVKIAQQWNKINEEVDFENVSDSIQIRGQIFDINGGLPGAIVILKGHPYGTETDFEGNFLVKIPKDELKKKPVLVLSFIGFETQEISINDETKFLKVKMIEDEAILGEVVIVKKRNIFRIIGDLFRKKDKSINP